MLRGSLRERLALAAVEHLVQHEEALGRAYYLRLRRTYSAGIAVSIIHYVRRVVIRAVLLTITPPSTPPRPRSASLTGTTADSSD